MNIYKNITIFLPIFVIIFTSSLSINAQMPGDLDLSFGGTGFQQMGFELSGREVASSSALQSDGKLVVVGFAYFGSSSSFAITRYTETGILDSSFGNNGKILQKFNQTGSGSATAVAIQTDGKILVAGVWGGFAVARYNSDGTLDTTFDSDGLVITNSVNQATDITVQPDGKIVVVGHTGGFADFAVVRYNTNGSLDTSFSGDGIFTTAIGPSNDIATSVAIQSNGNILIGGYANESSGNRYDFAAIRLLSNGTLDTTFSSDGKVTTAISPTQSGAGNVGNDYGRSIKVLSDGKIILSGDAYFTDGPRFSIVKYNANGTLDTSFDSDGIVSTFMTNNVNNDCYAMELQSDGKIVLGGRTTSNITLARYNINGSLDTTFDTDGYFRSTFSGIPNALSIQSDGKFVISAGGTNNAWAVARFNSDASVDTTFGTSSGIINTSLGSEADFGEAIALQSDGKILITGNTPNFYNSTFQLLGIARYNSNGTLDQTFGVGGRVVNNTRRTGKSIAVQSDGKIVVATADSTRFEIVRYDSSGTIDTTFGTNGTASTVIDSQASQATAEKLLITADGKILVAGFASFPTTSYDFVLIRYNSNGTLDTNFDTDGIVTTTFGGPRPEEKCFSMALQTDGKIVLAGQSNGEINYAISRYNSDGSLDTTFDTDGKLELTFGTLGAQAIAIQGDGKIVAVGAAIATGRDFATLRFNTNGSLDTTFDTDGIVTTSLSSSEEIATSVVALNSGKILVGGNTNSNQDFALVRYNADGSLDNSFWSNKQNGLFGNGGIVVTDFGREEIARDMLVQNDGKIVLAGIIDRLFGITRYYDEIAPTAANADISGRVVDEFGRGISRATVSLQNTQTGEIITKTTGTFGHFDFSSLPVGNFYILTVADGKRYVFKQNTQSIQLFENVSGITFVGTEN